MVCVHLHSPLIACKHGENCVPVAFIDSLQKLVHQELDDGVSNVVAFLLVNIFDVVHVSLSEQEVLDMEEDSAMSGTLSSVGSSNHLAYRACRIDAFTCINVNISVDRKFQIKAAREVVFQDVDTVLHHVRIRLGAHGILSLFEVAARNV